MKKLLLPLVFLLLLAPARAQEGTTNIYVYSTSLAGVRCNPNQKALWIIKSGGSAGVYRCSATDTFTKLGDVSTARAINTTSPLTGGGDLSADRTIACPTCSTPSSADALTNKTYDAEATGNTLTLPFKLYFPGGGCSNATASDAWDLPASSAATSVCVTGSNTQKGALQFTDAANSFAQQTFLLPSDWSGGIDADVIFTTTDTTQNNTVKFTLATACRAADSTATDDPAFNTAQTLTFTIGAGAVASAANKVSQTTLTVTGCSAGNLLHLKLGRDTSDSSTATANVVGVQLTIRRAM